MERFSRLQEEISRLRKNLNNLVKSPQVNKIENLQVVLMGKLEDELIYTGENKLANMEFENPEHFKRHVEKAIERTNAVLGYLR